jgi:hypothetical protein
MYDCSPEVTMRFIISLVAFLSLTNVFSTIQHQQRDNQTCGFTVQGEPAHVAVTGPDDIVPLVYVVEQPDSPIEILSVDLQGMWLSVSGEQHVEHVCNKFIARNRSDRIVQRFDIELLIQKHGWGWRFDSAEFVTACAGPKYRNRLLQRRWQRWST